MRMYGTTRWRESIDWRYTLTHLHTYCTHTNLILKSTMQIVAQNLHSCIDTEMCIKTLNQEVGQKHDKKGCINWSFKHQHQASRSSTWVYSNLGLLKQNLIKAILLLPCVKSNPHSICLPTHQPRVNNGPALNFEVNLIQNFIRWGAHLQQYTATSKLQSFIAEVCVVLKWAQEN